MGSKLFNVIPAQLMMTKDAYSSPHRGEVGWGACGALPVPNNAPTPTLPLRGREYQALCTALDALTLALKAATHPTTHYIWRTRGDGKVRASHAANDGRVFAWDNPPPTGHQD